MQSYPNFNPPSLWGTSTNRNRFQGIDISGSLDISGGPLTIQNNQFGIYENGQPRLRINPWTISVTNYDPSGNTYTSVDISMNKLILIKDISVNVSESFGVINEKTKYIGTNGDYTNFSSNVDISGNTNIRGNLTTNSYAIFSGTGDASFNIPIKATSATFNGLIQAKADASLNGNVNIGGLTTISGDLSLNRNINIQGNSTIYGDQTIKGNLFIDGSYTYINTNQLQVIDPIITINKNGLTVTNLGVEFNQVVNQIESTTGYIKSDSVTGSTFLIKAPGPSSTEGIIVQQNTSNNTVYIENIDISGTTRANGDISANQNVRIQYDLSVNRNAFIKGDLSVNQLTRIQDLSVNQNAFIRGDLSANGQFKGTTASLTSNLTSSNGVLQFSNSTGNSWIGIGTGNVGINQNNPSANLDVSGTVNITSNTIVGGDLSANRRLLVQGDASFNSNVGVASVFTASGNIVGLSDLSLNGRALIQKDVSMNANAFVASTFTASGNIVALSDLSINQRLLVEGDASFNRNAFVTSTLTASGNIVALSDISANNRLLVQGDASFNANVGVASTLTASGNIVALSDISANGRLLVQGDASFNANVRVASTLTASGNIVALSDISANGRLLVQSDASFNANVRVASIFTASGNIVALSDISANGNLYLQKDASLNGVVKINNTFSPTDIALDVSGGQNIRGNAYIQKLYLASTPASTVPTSTDLSGLQIYWDNTNTINRIQVGQSSDRRLRIDASAVGIDITPSTNAVFEVLGNTLIRGSVGIITDGETLPDYTNFKLDISGNTITRGRATITDLSVNRNLYVQSDASFNANVRVASVFTASGNIVALSDLSINQRLLVQEDASFNSNVRVASVFTASGNIVGLSDISLNGRALIQNDASFNANVRVASTFTASGNIVALSDISANRNIYVQGDASFNGNVRINGGFLSGEKIVQLYGGPIGTPTTIPIQSTTSTLNYGLNIDTRFDTSGGFSATGTTVTGIQRGPIISMDRSGAYQFYCTPDASGIYYRYDFSSNSNAGFTPFETTPNSNNRYSTMSCTANGNYLFVGFSNNGGTDSSTNIVRKFDVSTKPTTLPVDVSLQLYPYSSTDFIRNISSDNTGQKIVIGTTKGLYISTDGLISVNYVTLNDPSASQITNQPSGYYSTNIYNTKITPDGTKIFAILKKNTGDLSYNLCYGNFPSDGSLVNTKLTANPTSMYCPIFLAGDESSGPGAWAKMAMSDNGKYIYIGSKTGIYRSTDGGQTISFIELSGNATTPINVVACDSTGKYVTAITTTSTDRYSAFSTNYGSTFNSFTVSLGTIRFTDILISDISAVSGFIYAIAGNRNPASGSVRTEIFNPQPAYNYFSFGNSTIDGQYLNLLSYDQNSKNILPSSTTLNYGESPVTQLTMSDTNNNVKMRWDNQAGKWYIRNNDRAQMTNSTVDVPFMIGGNTIIRGKATTTDLSVNRYFYVQGDASFNANVRVATVFTASGNIVALSDISANGQLLVQGDASLNGKLLVQSDASFNSKISVQSDASINGVVKINNINNATFSLDVSGNTITRGKTTTTDLSVNRYFYVQGDASFNGKIVQNLSGTNIQFGDSNTYLISSGQHNVAIGKSIMNNITTGAFNTSVGNASFSASVSGSYNSSFGYASLFSTTTGNNNTALGFNALYNNTNGSNSTSVGYQSLFSNRGGNTNVAIGFQSGYFDISGNNNTYIGTSSGPSTDNSANTYTYLTCIGARSGSDASLNGSNRIILGSSTGSEDVILGGTGKLYTRSGANIDFSGNRIITGDISCNRNLYVQSDASLNGRLLVQSDASFNSKISVQSDASINGVVKINNINNATFSLDVSGRTRIYEPTGTDSSSNQGTLVLEHGDASGTSSIVFKSKNVTGNDYAYIKYTDNLSTNAIPYVANTNPLECGALIIGVENDNSSGNIDRICIMGSNSGQGPIGINKFYPSLGYALDVGGSVNATTYNATSDYRIKTNIIPLEETHASVDTLRPVSYFNTLSAKQDYGFIAHEVAEYYPFLVNGQRDVSGEYQSLNYTGIIPILVKDLKQTKQELMETKQELMETKQELMETKQELMETKQELMETKQELSDLRERFSSLETTFANFLSK